jgi:hypothetical protein
MGRKVVTSREVCDTRGSGGGQAGVRRGSDPELAPERRLVHVVDEGSLAVDLDDRQPLAVARLQVGIPVDGDLLVVEPELGVQTRELPLRSFAQVAARCVVEGDARDRDRA